MQVEEARETLPGSIRLDPSTQLPLLSEQEAVLALVRAYQALPYSVAEHGCGKKTSLIIDQLIRIGVPAWALRRGMILERDLSPEALAQTDVTHRPHALLVDNPLYRLGDLEDPTLRGLLEEDGIATCTADAEIDAGAYTLHHVPQVQFVIARSHIFPILAFWDDETQRVVDRVIDPTLRRRALFEVEQMRELTRAPEALLFEAALGAHFRLSPAWLTNEQRAAITERLGEERTLAGLDETAHAELVRALTSAVPGSIGDPRTWTYANNVAAQKLHADYGTVDTEHDAVQRGRTGHGDIIAACFAELLAARMSANATDVDQCRAALQVAVDHSGVVELARQDAVWAARRLQPLASVAIAMVYHRSLGVLAGALAQGRELTDFVADAKAHRPLRGLGVRLRRRIEQLAVAALDDEGRIDGRALTPGYNRSAIETIRQMNHAGLTVFVDRVGNLHGLRLDTDTARRARAGELAVKDLTKPAIVHGSHIDTVNDAGKFDGRLGVTAGIEIAKAIDDLQRFHDTDLLPGQAPVRLAVTAFMGEEMTFTGRGVSMPGSAAVAGRARTEDVHEMTNADGDRFGDRLLEMLEALAGAVADGQIEVVNDLSGEGPALLEACSEPTDFYSRHTYERHIEQGPVLDRAEVPMALVSTIMGIHQEDFHFEGARAEAAALELCAGLRELIQQPNFSESRITVGLIETTGEPRRHLQPSAAVRCVLDGELNHAGATATADRHDPGVAAGRLARELSCWIDETGIRARPLVGDVELYPGTNRNVIPGRASVTLGIDTRDEIDEAVADDLRRRLRGFAAATLSRPVPEGGEGLEAWTVEPAGFISTHPRARLTTDLRAADDAALTEFPERMRELAQQIATRFDVRIEPTVEQHLAPQHIEATGQVLMMERSYGGSHNPRETELTMDLTRGCVVDLAVLLAVLRRSTVEDLNLVEVTDGIIPQRWRSRLARFVSGALHDTCNIAAAARAR